MKLKAFGADGNGWSGAFFFRVGNARCNNKRNTRRSYCEDVNREGFNASKLSAFCDNIHFLSGILYFCYRCYPTRKSHLHWTHFPRAFYALLIRDSKIILFGSFFFFLEVKKSKAIRRKEFRKQAKSEPITFRAAYINQCWMWSFVGLESRVVCCFFYNGNSRRKWRNQREIMSAHSLRFAFRENCFRAEVKVYLHLEL